MKNCFNHFATLLFAVVLLTFFSLAATAQTAANTALDENLAPTKATQLSILVHIDKNRLSENYQFSISDQSIRATDIRKNKHSIFPADIRQSNSEMHTENKLKCVFRDNQGRTIATAIVQNPLKLNLEGMTADDELTHSAVEMENGKVMVRTDYTTNISQMIVFEGDEDGSWSANPIGLLAIETENK